MEVAGCFAEFLPVLCLVESPDGFERCGWSERGPGKGDGILFWKFPAAAILERDKLGIIEFIDIFQSPKRIRDHRSMACAAHRDLQRVAIGHRDHFITR